MKYLFYKVFTRNNDGGNPAAAVFCEDLETKEFEKIARSIDSYLTVFIVEKENNSGVRLRFFGTKGEMDFCGHGILAAGHAFSGKSGKSDFLFETNAKAVHLTVSGDSLVQFITENSTFQTKPVDDKSSLLEKLSIDKRIVDMNEPFCVASIGSPKLLVPIRDLESLGRLDFDLKALENWSASEKVNGAYFYTFETLDKQSWAQARAFNPLHSSSEDAGTGVAAAALVAAGKGTAAPGDYVIEQGDFIGVKCSISVSLDPENIKVGGFVKLER